MARVDLTADVLGDDEPDRPAPQPATSTTPRKYTMLLTDHDLETARMVTAMVVSRAGIRTTKSMRAEMVRALFAEAEADADLRGRLAERLRRAVEES